MRVVVLGASDKEDRYSNRAIKFLGEQGHEAIPVHPVLKTIAGLEVKPDLKSVTGEVDTLTVYLNPNRSAELVDDMVALAPKRVILNPGTESNELKKSLSDKGIEVLEACTLVLLRTSQF